MRYLTTLLCFTLVALGCGSNSDEMENKETVVSVITTNVKRGVISSFIHTTGAIFPKQESMISPKVSGRIEKLKETEAQLKNLQATLKRNQRLFEEGVIGSQQFDDTTTERDLAEARVQRAEAVLERMQQDLKDSVITAPFDGFIVEKMMNEGEMATTMPPSNIFHLVDTSRIKIECGITEGKRKSIKVGEEVLVTVDAYPDEVFTGKITTVNPKIDLKSRTFKIKTELPNPSFRLESGMFARIRIIESESNNALLIPQRVIISGEVEKKVFVVENGRAVEKSIVTGIMDHPIVEVTEGLKEGDIVVTEGFYALKDGIKVRVKQDLIKIKE
jgi:HlyD family secretion protein